MLNGGSWDGNQIVSENWVEKCTTPWNGNTSIKVPGEDLGKVGYAYTWWTKDFTYNNDDISMFFALGWGGQKIIVIPDLDVVVAFNGANYTSKVHQFEIMESFVLAAINN